MEALLLKYVGKHYEKWTHLFFSQKICFTITSRSDSSFTNYFDFYLNKDLSVAPFSVIVSVITEQNKDLLLKFVLLLIIYSLHLIQDIIYRKMRC
jgi:hypothetical protein